MTLKEYQEAALKTWTMKDCPDDRLRYLYLNLGLRGEAGEVCDKVKKLIRDSGWTPGQPVPDDKREGILLELGDVCWYLAVSSYERHQPMYVSHKLDATEDVDNLFRGEIEYDLAERGIELMSDIMTYFVSDALFCVHSMAQILGTRLSDVMQRNIEKLQHRMENNSIHGSGDNR